ncbi:helix-turn-helix transcriptional regulator [Pseudomonas sp. CAN2814]|uniref:AraC family transcriptional regulator n=1 Tax=Pseudomonas sp. CAN1 TaxID=3046726 RepID=UPI0026471106|nr:helix-turn-helix transcriptional regulator [Pseudomonas sp. CAN1]MDN6858866.1 helix-turn-helix transcriptional regulator [Pseudomonas sp. CAN1]
MINIPLHSVDATDRPVLAIATDYPLAKLLTAHAHRRAQFLYGMSGLMEVETEDGAWVIPPYSGVWIPPGKSHRVLMRGVSTRSLYIEPDVPVRDSALCEAVVVSPLLHQLLLSSATVPAAYDEQGRDGDLVRLLLHELRGAPSLPLFAPFPRDARLAELCREFMREPGIGVLEDDWAARLSCSARTFRRLFRQQTGLSFGAWRQQACLLAAVTRLAAGTPVTRVALELGYDSPSAFSSMFRRCLGSAPSAYLRALSVAEEGTA